MILSQKTLRIFLCAKQETLSHLSCNRCAAALLLVPFRWRVIAPPVQLSAALSISTWRHVPNMGTLSSAPFFQQIEISFPASGCSNCVALPVVPAVLFIHNTFIAFWRAR
jgi:hypothetical protein